MDDKTTNELLNLKKLHETGVLTDSEYASRRSQLVASGSSVPVSIDGQQQSPLNMLAASALFAQCGAVLFTWMTFHSNMKGGGRTSTAYGDMDSTFDVDGMVITLSGLQHWTGQFGLLLAIAGLVLVFQRSSHLKVLSIATAVFAASMVFLLIPEASFAGTSQIDGSFGSEFGSVKSSATLKSWFEPAIGAWVYFGAAIAAFVFAVGEQSSERGASPRPIKDDDIWYLKQAPSTYAADVQDVMTPKSWRMVTGGFFCLVACWVGVALAI